jgi:ethanolamine utilization microcompartment shell protein EutS
MHPAHDSNDAVARLRGRLKRQGLRGSLTFLPEPRLFSLVAADSATERAALRAGFEERPSGALVSPQAIAAARFVDLATPAALEALQSFQIDIEAARRTANISARRRETREANLFNEALAEHFDTFDGWKAKGRSIMKGEKASRRVGETRLFHFSQTCDRALFSKMEAEGMLTEGRWAQIGRIVLPGTPPDSTHEGVSFFRESSTRHAG